MPANHRVSVAWQIVATFVPIVNFWAFYRIRKLQRCFLYLIVPEIIVTTIFVSYIYGAPFWSMTTGPPANMSEALMKYEKDQMMLTLVQVAGLGLQGFAIYLVIIWSRQHNRTFDTAPSSRPPA